MIDHQVPPDPSLPPRTPWWPDFPQVVVYSQTELRDFHQFYLAAKVGDREAALFLAEDLLSPTGRRCAP